MSLRTRFALLVCLVFISGFVQGMLLPLLSILLEQRGVPSSINGLHATGLYIGVLLASPFMEKPLRAFGYKPLITVGAFLMIVSLFLFPVWDALWFWFILRLVIGVGDQMLHFATQTWVTASAKKESVGRSISIYGFSFGVGFAVGPFMTRMLDTSTSLPFILSALIILGLWLVFQWVRNEKPQDDDATQTADKGAIRRFGKTLRYAWFALLPPFGYGLIEATLHSSFPVHALRNGFHIDTISNLLPLFAIGGLVSQIPLGILSDRIGRKKILLIVHFGGFASFTAATFLESHPIGLAVSLFIAGMFIGSAFSLGISYMTDVLPKHLLPAGNLLCGIFFSIGSMAGPFAGGIYMQVGGQHFFYIISIPLLFIFGLLFFGKQGARTRPPSQSTSM
ncbi:MFS transporter [Bacillaceae bacterium SIJ1]|uniref:MFS transporter n=1 Tax=Litoribacterium kuwaitense TaxID=1398745 RepID=UPI0013EBB22B|nr:MFS transporter [Litoribacterium kuwaitense]NGP46048.1 MFS transporter [Litoribacterium kuwaitense]